MAVITTAAITTAAAGYSAYQSTKAGKKSSRARDRQTDLQEQQIQVQRDRLAWAQQTYDGWRNEFDPILSELKTEALNLKRPDYEAITADNKAAFNSAKRSSTRNLSRYGVTPGSGARRANERRFGIGAALSEVNARQGARRNATNDRYQRLNSLYGIGANLQVASLGNVDAAHSGLANSFGNASNTAGDQANFYDSQSRAYAQQAGSAAASAYGQWGDLINGAAAGGGG